MQARIAAAVLLVLPLAAQTSAPPLKTRPQHTPSTAEQALPLRRVSLYKNGVGFFEHSATVNGSAHLNIHFTTAQLNDVLQTLTAIDLGGGHITSAAYNSTTPLEQQLKNLSFSLSPDAKADDYYRAIRGARVEVTGAGAPVTGRVLNVERRKVEAIAKTAGPPALKHVLTIITDSGAARTIELTGNTSVRVLDPALRDGVDRYLQLVNSTHSDGLRELKLNDIGTGTRELHVSYISEVPVWKSTYRILFDKKPANATTETATLQGWAVVDNTVGTDWDNVQLSLIAGSPQSFIQPISQPYYARRPEIPLPEEARLTPQTHESGTPSEIVQAQVAGGGAGIGTGSGGGIMGGLAMNGRMAKKPMELDRFASVAAAPLSYADSAAESIAPNTTTNAFDDYFEYKLSDPITLKRNESVLVPILQAKVPTERVTLWSLQQSTPLRALWITNTSNLTLDRGSFSIVEDGNFGGQGLLDPIHAGEKRLLSYAADQAISAHADGSNKTTRRLQQVAISKGVLTEKTIEIAEQGYLVHNAASETRTVIVEHRRHPNWTLDSDPKPAEETPALYRFRVIVQPNENVRLHVGERHTVSIRYELARMNQNQIDLLLRTSGEVSPQAQQTLREKLQPVIDARRKLSDLDTQIANRKGQIDSIGQDQKRLRDNLSALKNSAEERDLVRRYTNELNQQEDRIAALQKEVEAFQQQRAAAQADLDNAVEGLQFEQDLS